jgi:hypothetical protein
MTDLPVEDNSDGKMRISELWPQLNKAMATTCIEGKVLLRMSRLFSALYALFMGFITVFLLTIGLSLGHVYMSMGCLVGSAVGPCTFSILYEKTNGTAVSAGAVGGLVLSMVGWVIAAQAEFGKIGYETMMSDWPWVVSNLCALFGGLAITWIGTIIKPDRTFKWSMIDDSIPLVDDALPKKDPVWDSDAALAKEVKLAVAVSVTLTVIFIGLWPLPQHLGGGIMGDGDFAFWVALTFMIAFLAGIFICVFPIFEVYRDIISASGSRVEVRTIKLMTADEISMDEKRQADDANEKAEFYDRMASRKQELCGGNKA